MTTRTVLDRGAVERDLISSVYPEVLGTDCQVGPDDDFFGLGGDSIELMRLVALAQERFDVDVEIQDFFATPTAACLADLVWQALPARGSQ